MVGRDDHRGGSRIVQTVIFSDLDQSLVTVMAFLVALCGLLFALAWLEQPHRAPRLLTALVTKVRPRPGARSVQSPEHPESPEDGGC